MTDAKGASAPGFQLDWDDAEKPAAEPQGWLWLAQWLEDMACTQGVPWVSTRLVLSAYACRQMHKRESGDG